MARRGAGTRQLRTIRKSLSAIDRALRQHKGKDGRELDEFMPRLYKGMSDGEVHVIWTYLRTVDARPTGD